MPTLLPPWAPPEKSLARYFDEGDAEEEEEEGEEEEPSEEQLLTPLVDPLPGFLEARDETTFLRLQRTLAAAVAVFDAGLQLLVEDLRSAGCSTSCC